MRAQDTILRPIQSKAALDGQLVTFEMPRDMDYATIEVFLYGTVTVTTSGGSVHSNAPLQLLKNILLQANGSKNLCNASGQILYIKNQHQNNGLVAPLAAPSGYAPGTYTVAAVVNIDQDMIDGINPKDSQLPSSNLSSLNLQVQVGQGVDLFSTGAAAFSGTISVSATQVREYKGTDGTRYTPAAVQYVNELALALPTSQNNLQQLLTSNIVQRSLYFYTSISGEPSDAVLNNVRLERNGTTLANITGTALKHQMARSWNINIPTGYYVLDPSRSWGQRLAKLTDAIDMRPAAGTVADQLYLYLDVNGSASNKIQIAQNTFENYKSFIG